MVGNHRSDKSLILNIPIDIIVKNIADIFAPVLIGAIIALVFQLRFYKRSAEEFGEYF